MPGCQAAVDRRSEGDPPEGRSTPAGVGHIDGEALTKDLELGGGMRRAGTLIAGIVAAVLLVCGTVLAEARPPRPAGRRSATLSC